MDEIFKGLPLEIVFWGNLLISIVGFIFIFTAPVSKRNNNLKIFYSLFWASLILYYISRIIIGYIDHYRPLRMTAFINPWNLSNIYELSITKHHWAWMFLVILADLPLLILCLSHYYHKIEKIKLAHTKVGTVIIFISFALVWFIDFVVNNNALSSAVAFIVFFYTAWACRIEHISSSILWIIYAFLHLPLGIAVGVPIEWRHSIFVALLVSKLSLVAAMYNILEVKKSQTFA